MAKQNVLSVRRAGQLAEARKHFAQLADTNNPALLKAEIDRILKKAGLGYETLDPSGRSSAASIQASIESIVALQGVSEPGTGAPAPTRRALVPTAAIVVRRVRVGAIHASRHVLKAHDRVRRITVTRHMAQAALLANGFVLVGLLTYALIATIDNYTDPGTSDSFSDRELSAVAPSLFTAASFAVALRFFGRRNYRGSFKLSAPLSFAVAMFGLVVYLNNPEALDRIVQRFQTGLRPAALATPYRAAPSQMWTGH